MRWFVLLSLIFVFGACSGDSNKETDKHWSYEGDTGPEHWAELDPAWETAARGRSQSPIDGKRFHLKQFGCAFEIVSGRIRAGCVGSKPARILDITAKSAPRGVILQ